MMQKCTYLLALAALSPFCMLSADNQTPDVSPVVVGGELPYQVVIEEAFTLPAGVHSYASASYKGLWLILAGRTNGMHDFENNNDNFPPSAQNTTVFVIDPIAGTTYTKSLTDPTSGLSQAQVDTLSVTSPQSFQDGGTLYMTGGYGVDTDSGNFSTKPVLTAIDIKGFIHWVVNPTIGETAAQHIRQTTDEAFRVTGGAMFQSNKNLTLLIYGQNFQGYYLPESSGAYTQQIRRFKIKDSSKKLSYHLKNPLPPEPQPDLRRRDLNVVPVIHDLYGTPLPAYLALSGVFTLTDGMWTVPVLIDYWGNSQMNDPADPTTFKQAMNNYACAFAGAYSKESKTMYVTLFGGISYGYFDNGIFTTDAELPFINQVTTIAFDKEGNYTQYLMQNEYPVILSTGSNPGNQLLFGTGARFFHAEGVPNYSNKVLKLDKLRDDTVIGYIVGGIMSTLPNTVSASDSTASPYVFKVTLQPQS
jgi:hypothetical protein